MKRSMQFKRFAAVVGVFVLASLSVFARDSQTIRFPYAASLAGAEVQPGAYELSWVSHSPEATITLKHGKNVVATVEGKWEERNVKCDRNSIVYEKSGNGSRKIVEIRLAGKSQVLVFENNGSGQTSSTAASTASVELPCEATAAVAAFAVSAGSSRCIQFLGKPKVVKRASTFDDVTGDLWRQVFPGGSHVVVPQRR